ncbi:hypothetical protein [uncultured Lamprocystis sp.]|uniref:hypothetical protein n=1 Tax=uncultured Lamprocystis sp. TaxID=543132 RepID=UPI0025FD9057|nr:hypothetical protein [uncultured Lamprocystis sp.]
MRDFIRRFRRAIRTIPRRVWWILITPVAFIALFLIDGKMALTVFFAVFAWLVVVQLYRDRQLVQATDKNILDGMINPATGLMMNGDINIGGNSYRMRTSRRFMRML